MWDILVVFFLSAQFQTEYAEDRTHCREFQSGCLAVQMLAAFQPLLIPGIRAGNRNHRIPALQLGRGGGPNQWKTHKFRQTKHSNKYLIRKQTWNHQGKVGIRKE